MSVDNINFIGNLKSSSFQDEGIYERNFQELQESFSHLITNILCGGDRGEGRLFYSRGLFDIEKLKLSYSFSKNAMDGIFSKSNDFDFLVESLDMLPSVSIDELHFDVDDVRKDLNHLIFQVKALSDYLLNIMANARFPLNIFERDLYTSTEIRSELNLGFTLLGKLVSNFNSYNVSGAISHLLMFSGQNKENTIMTRGDFTYFATEMAMNFSNGFDLFISDRFSKLSAVGSLLKRYETDVVNFLDSMCVVEMYSHGEVSVMDMVGPYSFLELVLITTKHAIELRESLTIIGGMIK